MTPKMPIFPLFEVHRHKKYWNLWFWSLNILNMTKKRTFCRGRTAKTKAIKPGIFSLLTVLGKWPVNVPYALILDQYHLKPLAEAIWACKISNLVSSWQNMPMTESKMSYTYFTNLSENTIFSSKLSIVWKVIWLEPGILFHQLFGYWVTKGSLTLLIFR